MLGLRALVAQVKVSPLKVEASVVVALSKVVQRGEAALSVVGMVVKA